MNDDYVYLLTFQQAGEGGLALAFDNAEACLACLQYLKVNYDVLINSCGKIHVSHHMNEEIKSAIDNIFNNWQLPYHLGKISNDSMDLITLDPPYNIDIVDGTSLKE